MKLQETVDYHIKSTWHAITRMYNQIASQYGISQTIGYVLINVEKTGTPATKIAPLMGMEPTSLSRLLKTMEDNGLIYRQGDELDKRIVRIFLTDLGTEKRRLAKRVIKDFNEKLEHIIPQNDLATFLNVINKINSLTKDFKDKEYDL
jgi:DNA-binding MarR family transcriptional regulator